MIDPYVALRMAVASALESVGFGDLDDEQVEDFLIALKDQGYVVIREVNGVVPGKQE